jgi:hypothetical protein
VLQNVIRVRVSADRVVVTTPACESSARPDASICGRCKPLLVRRRRLNPRLRCGWHIENCTNLDELQLGRLAAWSRGIVLLLWLVNHKRQRWAIH